MTSIADLPNQSESSDEDYVPEGNAVLPSEEESDGEPEDDLPSNKVRKARGKRRKKTTSSRKIQRKVEESATVEPEEKKSDADTGALWADFIKDTGFKTKAERLNTAQKTVTEENKKTETPKEAKSAGVEPSKKIKVAEVLKFAGEEITIEKEVSVDSVGDRLNSRASTSDSSKKPVGKGLGSILNQLGKKRKINTLEKSKMDWDKFKKEEKIEDELQAYGKSKDGYLERQDFLQRADVRRFEIEKEIRSSLRSNRMNNL